MRAPSNRHSQLKQSWLRALRAGVGSVVVATAVVAAPAANAAIPVTRADVEARVQQIREEFQPGVVRTLDGVADERVAWWGNRVGVVVRPAWPNWPNWHNWPNWGNFGPGWANF